MWGGAATQRPVNAAGLEPRRPASLFHFIPRRSSDRRRPPVIHLSRLPRVRGSSVVRSLDSFPVRRTYHQSRAANGAPGASGVLELAQCPKNEGGNW
jgi:hypothetical protein